MKLLRVALFGAGLLLAVPAAAQDASRIIWAKSGPTVPLTVSRAGATRRFRVEQAQTPQAQEQGLMFRKSMPRDHGMIFPMAKVGPATFWMKNTYLPLDIIFIGPDRRILQVSANAVPLSTAIVGCDGPVAAVLELNGGVAAALHIKDGDTVRW